jgi:hypothetical protein
MGESKRSSMNFETARDLAFAYPGVAEGAAYGTRALRVNGKFMARLREDGVTLVLKLSEPEREVLMSIDPETFYITEHYRNYDAVLVRLDRVEREDLSDVIEQSWRWVAPRKLVAEYERTHPGP